MNSIPSKVTVICLGNICRSPVAEHLLRFYASQSNNPKIQKIIFDSAGLSGGIYDMADNSERFLDEKGINFSKFVSKSTSRKYLEQYDRIIVLEEYMKDEILRKYFNQYSLEERKKIEDSINTLSEAGDSQGDIDDPYGYGRARYYEILREIDHFCKQIILSWEKIQ
jgi:protein-tyrosine-phosphatase